VRQFRDWSKIITAVDKVEFLAEKSKFNRSDLKGACWLSGMPPTVSGKLFVQFKNQL
jgi:hypothetical protein